MTITVTTGGPVATSSTTSKDYTWLKNAVSNWMARSDLSGEVADIILIAEARLNRELGAFEVDETLTGTVGERAIDISSLAMTRPVALFLVDSSTSDEVELTQKSDGTFPYVATSGTPQMWTIDTILGGDFVEFDCPLDAAYTFRFRYWSRFELSDTATDNWLLVNHPDVYLAAALVWGGLFTRDSDIGATYAAILENGLREVKHNIAQRKRAVASVDRVIVTRQSVYRGGWAA